MRLIEQSVELLPEPALNEDAILRKLELAARTCYKSESKIGPNSHYDLIRKIIRMGHESPLEHQRLAFGWRYESHQAYVALLEELVELLDKTTGVAVSFGGRERCLLVSLNIRTLRDARRRLTGEFVDSMWSALCRLSPVLCEGITGGAFVDPALILVPSEVRNCAPISEADRHISATVRIISDRGVLNEWVRHRLGAHSQVSTRYVSYAYGDIAYVQPSGLPLPERAEWLSTCQHTERSYQAMSNRNVSPQLARSVLPLSLGSEIVSTFTLHWYKHILSLRASPKAHPQMQEVAQKLKILLQQRYSASFPKEINV